MKTRQQAITYGLTFPYTYVESPFKDPNWELVRVKGSKKAFLWVYEKDGYINLNIKVDPEWREFWREAYDAVIPGYHQNKKYWNTIILDGTIPEKDIKKALASSKKGYLQPCDIWHLEDKVKDVLSIGNQTGEGWFLTAEMIEYMEHDIPNIICVQPFACLPNHVVGKGVIKTIREKYPEANISPVDYDPGASETNQANRIKLLMTVAKDNLVRQENEKKALDGENNNKETVLL